MRQRPRRPVDWYGMADREARAVLAALPSDLRGCLEDVAITLDPVPRRSEEQEAGDEDDLLGLFDGPTYAECGGGGELPRAIHLFIENIRDEAGDDPVCFRQEVRTTLLHEIGHYLGLEEDEIELRGLG